MMKRRLGTFVLLTLLASGFVAPGMAQEKGTVTPSTKMVPLPQAPKAAPAPATQGATFPTLPMSVPCVQKDMLGLWRLSNVYELPAGTETASFTSSPVQYMLFDTNSTYAKYNAGTAALPAATAMAEIRKHSSGLLQYVVQNNMVYFYKDRAVSDTQACFIVSDSLAPFARGQMILMPPKGAISGRLVKTYTKLWSPGAPKAEIRPNQKNKKNMNKKKRTNRKQQRRHQTKTNNSFLGL